LSLKEDKNRTEYIYLIGGGQGAWDVPTAQDSFGKRKEKKLAFCFEQLQEAAINQLGGRKRLC